MEDSEIDELIKEVDIKGNGMINYSEFIAATIKTKEVLTEARLWAIFKQFDSDNSESITVKNLKEAFANLGKPLSDADIKDILMKDDVKKDGKISFEEFRNLFMGN